MKTVKNTPVDTQQGAFFWDGVDAEGRDVGGLSVGAVPVYSDEDRAAGRRLRDLRVHGLPYLTLGALAATLGVSAVAISDLEQGRTRPATPEDAEKLHAALTVGRSVSSETLERGREAVSRTMLALRERMAMGEGESEPS